MSAFTDEEYRRVLNERDEARAEVERLRKEYDEAIVLHRWQMDTTAQFAEECADAGFRHGAEVMREACAVALMADGLVLSRERAAKVVRALPIPEEP